jgi:apolipoprotein D and lipocalin family protein
MRPSRSLLPLAAALAAAAPALAAAPEPQKPVNPSQYTGRYYEIARLPNTNQRNCHAPTYDWARGAKGDMTISLTCRQGSPTGKASVRKANARIIDPATNAKMKVSFLGGIASAEYRVIDHSGDWVLMGTSGGNYLWLLSRTPNLSEAARNAAVARAKALGYDVARFEYPKHG